MTNFIIRPAKPADLSGLLELYHHLDTASKPCTTDEAFDIFDRFLNYSGSSIFAGFIGDRLVSSCTIVIIPNLTHGGMPYGLIENVVTHPENRNRGFGKSLLAAAVDRAWAEGCYKVMLMTGSRKPATLAFYKSAGFEQSKTGFQIRRKADD